MYPRLPWYPGWGRGSTRNTVVGYRADVSGSGTPHLAGLDTRARISDGGRPVVVDRTHRSIGSLHYPAPEDRVLVYAPLGPCHFFSLSVSHSITGRSPQIPHRLIGAVANTGQSRQQWAMTMSESMAISATVHRLSHAVEVRLHVGNLLVGVCDHGGPVKPRHHAGCCLSDAGKALDRVIRVGPGHCVASHATRAPMASSSRFR